MDVSTYPVRCNQCADAPCVHACPTEATHQREDGIVVIDSDKCIGCRYCVIACPYQNRTFLSKEKDPGYFPGFERTRFEKKGRSSTRTSAAPPRSATSAWSASTTACRVALPGVDRDATPACVNTCQARALTFGDLDDPDSNVNQLLRKYEGFQLRAEYGTDPSVRYIDYRLGGNDNRAPREAQTGSHIQHLSSVDRDAYRRIYGHDKDDAEVTS